MLSFSSFILKASTYKVVGFIGALFARHNGVCQSSGGARDGQKLSVAHVEDLTRALLDRWWATGKEPEEKKVEPSRRGQTPYKANEVAERPPSA